jgi:3-deoxy-7-phosphoheptulonate synthase
MIDCSHGNSDKDHTRQPLIVRDVAAQVAAGSQEVCGIMLESHLVEGKQKQRADGPLVYGQSITDACIPWEVTGPLLDELAAAVCERRKRG